MKRVTRVHAAAAAVVICGLVGCERQETARHTLGSIVLQVSNEYLLERRGWWADPFGIFDNDADQLAIRVPERDLSRLLQTGSTNVRSYAMLMRVARRNVASTHGVYNGIIPYSNPLSKEMLYRPVEFGYERDPSSTQLTVSIGSFRKR